MARPHVDDFAGDEYYVDASGGSDLNAGTSDAAAWQTINHAISTGIPGVGYNTTDGVRLNIKSNADHVITTPLTSGGTLYAQLNGGSAWSSAAGFIIQGYTSTANDGGVGTIVNNCGGSVRFIEDSLSDYWSMFDLHVKTGTSSRLIRMDRNCFHMDCAFTDGATASTGDVIYTNVNSSFFRCYFQLAGAMRYSPKFVNCVFANNSSNPIINQLQIEVVNSLFIQYGSANKTAMCYAAPIGCAFVNVGTGTVTYGAYASGSNTGGIHHNYFENVTTPIYISTTKTTSSSIYNNLEYNCTNQSVVYGATNTSGHSCLHEDVVTISASPFSAISETGFTLGDGANLLRDLNIGTDNGDGWSGTLKRFAGTGGPISGGSSTPAAAVRHTRLK